MQSNIGRIVFALEDPEGETLLPPRRGNSANKRPGYQRPDVQPFILREESADLLREYANLRLPKNQRWRIEWPKRLAAQTPRGNAGETLVSFSIVITGQAMREHVAAAAAYTGPRGPGTPVCTLCGNETLELTQ